MKQILSPLLSCWVAIFFIAATDSAVADSRPVPVADALLCLDSMETVPFNDDLEPTPIAADNGCMILESVISI